MVEDGLKSCENLISLNEKALFFDDSPFTLDKITDTAQTVAAHEKLSLSAGRAYERGSFGQKQQQYENDTDSTSYTQLYCFVATS